MKKILYFLTIILSVFIMSNSVNASSFKVNLIGNDTFENEITLQLEVSDITDFKGNCNGLCGLIGELEYDSEKIELVSISSLEEFELVNGGSIVLYKSTGVKNNTKILSLTFKNKSLINDEITKIVFKNIVASDGDNDIKTTEIFKELKYVEVITEKEEEKVKVNSKNESKVKTNYLTKLELSSGNITFSKDVFEYNVTVDYDTDKIEINAESENKNASIQGIGNHDLKVGDNKIEIIVTDDEGNETKYTLNVKRSEKGIVEEPIQEETNSKLIYIIPIVVVIMIVVAYAIYKRKSID